MGQRDAFSSTDVGRLNNMYHCDNVDVSVEEDKEKPGDGDQLTPYATGIPTADPSAPFTFTPLTTTRRPSNSNSNSNNNYPVLNFLGGLVSSAIQSAGK